MSFSFPDDFKINIRIDEYDTNKNDDTLPFVEKFRPKKLKDVLAQNEIVSSLEKMVKNKSTTHFIFYGPPGTGKTSVIEAFVGELYGEENKEFMVMNINASEERGIDVVRSKIKEFISTIPVHSSHDVKIPCYKFVILDEADAMTYEAQCMLNRVIELYSFNVRFCLLCNFIKNINQSIQSRCILFKFKPLGIENVTKKTTNISESIGVEITPEGIDMLWKLSSGDMRKILYKLQILAINNKKIDEQTLINFDNYPCKKNIIKLKNFCETESLEKSVDFLSELIDKNSYSFGDIIVELSEYFAEEIIKKNDNYEYEKNMLISLGIIENNITMVSNYNIQIPALVSYFVKYRNL